jgi:SAM-dependent methyltransferase
MTMAGWHLRAGSTVQPFDRPALPLLIGSGLALAALGAALLLLGRRVSFGNAESLPERCASRPYVTLFLISFAVLFIEVLLIRYSGSQIRIFSFYKNVPLVSAFLGLGLGCCLGRGRTRHALQFLVWLLPLSVFLAHAAIAIDGYLGSWAAFGSSEHILGDVVAARPSLGQELAGQLLMSLFCAATLIAITSLFALLGRLLGDAFERVDRLSGYTVNIVGSLTGIVLFMVLSYLETPPWIWVACGLLPLLWWITGETRTIVAGVLILLNVAAVYPSYGDTVWSRYQKLVGHVVPVGPAETPSPAYLVQISDVFYQMAMDLRPAAVARLGRNPFPHYDAAFELAPNRDVVLVVGAGTGNDVAAALRAGARHVDAVDIDPAIVEMGRRHHPESPYGDPRVRVIVDDARRTFRRLLPASYDVVVFGLLDSHSQLGISSVRLDNYVFTLESLATARRLLRPGGSLIITASTFREWFRDRFAAMLTATCDTPVRIFTSGIGSTYVCQVLDPWRPSAEPEPGSRPLPTDDWPFLYLPGRMIPQAYMIAIVTLAAVSVGILYVGGLRLERFSAYHGHLFFLGAAFLLMEVYAINRLALLFGTTWLVSAVTIAGVLILVVCANLTVALWRSLPYGAAYAGLASAVLLGYFVGPSAVLGHGLGPSLLYAVVLLLPNYFAGLIFARSFRLAQASGPAIGVNVLGSVLGGWAEYATMALGIRSLALLALFFYMMALLMQQRSVSAQPFFARTGVDSRRASRRSGFWKRP